MKFFRRWSRVKGAKPVKIDDYISLDKYHTNCDFSANLRLRLYTLMTDTSTASGIAEDIM